MSDQDKDGSLSSLDARLAKARGVRQGEGSTGGPKDKELDSFVGTAFRISTELVAALVVGMLIGWALDRWLGTRPWMMVAFFFLGSVTGIWNVYRSVSGYGTGVGFGRSAGTDKPDDKQ